MGNLNSTIPVSSALSLESDPASSPAVNSTVPVHKADASDDLALQTNSTTAPKQGSASADAAAVQDHFPFDRCIGEIRNMIFREALKFDKAGRSSTNILATSRQMHHEGTGLFYEQALPITISADTIYTPIQAPSLRVSVGTYSLNTFKKAVESNGQELLNALNSWPAEIVARFKHLELRICDFEDVEGYAGMIALEISIMVMRLKDRPTSSLDVVVDKFGGFLEPLKQLSPAIKLSIRDADGKSLMSEFEELATHRFPFFQLLSDVERIQRASDEFETLLDMAGI